MPRFDAHGYYISDFLDWYQKGELELAPKFQRRAVWSGKARSYLIDTIVRGLPIPKIFMRHEIDTKTKKIYREIVDGQQRMRAILDYIDDGYSISRIHNEDLGNMFYSDLPPDIQKDFLSYEISVDVLVGASDSDVLDIFARLNSYTVVLNKQELLNSKYFGDFKQTVYSLGYEFADFWQNNNVLTHHDVVRMAEAELASELVILIVGGIQDRKVIESFYKKYEDELPGKKLIIERFRETVDTVAGIMGDRLGSSYFANTPLFYSLFGVLYDLKFGLTGMEESKVEIVRSHYAKISAALAEIDYILGTKIDEIASIYFEFYDASTKHVTDLSRRGYRHQFLKNFILQRLQR